MIVAYVDVLSSVVVEIIPHHAVAGVGVGEEQPRPSLGVGKVRRVKKRSLGH